MKKAKQVANNGTNNAVYGLGFVGALVYYFGHANSFWLLVLGFLKAVVWPAFVVYHLLGFLRM
jgi:fatty acid desaturase